MVCTSCKKEFCWIDLEDWSEYHYGHLGADTEQFRANFRAGFQAETVYETRTAWNAEQKQKILLQIFSIIQYVQESRMSLTPGVNGILE